MLSVSIKYFRSPSGLETCFFKAFYELLIEQSPSCEDILLSNDIFALSFSGFFCY